MLFSIIGCGGSCSKCRDQGLRVIVGGGVAKDKTREVIVTWRTPIPEAELNGEYILAWRESLVEGYYSFPQVVVSDQALATPGTMGGRAAYQIQAIWENPPEEYPAAGPFILRAVTCPDQDRLYLLDAWLYAPGKEKYEYMLQLETILNSFKC